jgi:fibronectin type 3 domain-containing protein
VVGYNVYRRTATSSYSKVNASLNVDVSYADTAVAAGQTYFYVVKSVDGNDVESGASNEVQVIIPSP